MATGLQGGLRSTTNIIHTRHDTDVVPPHGSAPLKSSYRRPVRSTASIEPARDRSQRIDRGVLKVFTYGVQGNLLPILLGPQQIKGTYE